ncbi:DUF2231 domain-containing protein [Paenibacillus sp. y28]|uniref:DUF2231 domain-containing protein n=1 Tax=Paenibacillus sp. y28 TaxID=3129110 RepID=UPI003015CC58
MSDLLGSGHFIVVYIPAALLLFSLLFDFTGAVRSQRMWHRAGLLCLIAGTLGAAAAVLAGPELDRSPDGPTYMLFSRATLALFLVLCLARVYYRFRRFREVGNTPVYLIASLVGVLLVSYTGHLGGQIGQPNAAGDKTPLSKKESPPSGQTPDLQQNGQSPEAGAQMREPGEGGPGRGNPGPRRETTGEGQSPSGTGRSAPDTEQQAPASGQEEAVPGS